MDNNSIIVYTVLEVSKILRVNKNKVYELIKAGDLHAMNLGGLKVPKFALEEFLRKYIGYDLENPYSIVKFQNVEA